VKLQLAGLLVVVALELGGLSLIFQTQVAGALERTVPFLTQMTTEELQLHQQRLVELAPLRFLYNTLR
jgi:hypothetical protein